MLTRHLVTLVQATPGHRAHQPNSKGFGAHLAAMDAWYEGQSGPLRRSDLAQQRLPSHLRNVNVGGGVHHARHPVVCTGVGTTERLLVEGEKPSLKKPSLAPTAVGLSMCRHGHLWLAFASSSSSTAPPGTT